MGTLFVFYGFIFMLFGDVYGETNDNYKYYLDLSGDIVNRYKNYNNVQGNSPIQRIRTIYWVNFKSTMLDLNQDEYTSLFLQGGASML